MKKGNYFKMEKRDEQRAEIFIYGDIVQNGWRWSEEETSAVSFRDALNDLGDVSEIDLRINSGGGDVFEAVAIYNMIKRHKAHVTAHIDGLAASAASVIAMAADRLVMPENGMLMIHNAWSVFMGDHHAFRKFADDLEKINSTVKQSYLDKKQGMDEAESSRMMDEETWLSANEAYEMGLADEVIAAVQVAASITKEQLARYEKVPSALKEANKTDTNKKDEQFAELKAMVEKLNEQMNDIKQHKQEPEPTPEATKASALERFFLNLN